MCVWHCPCPEPLPAEGPGGGTGHQRERHHTCPHRASAPPSGHGWQPGGSRSPISPASPGAPGARCPQGSCTEQMSLPRPWTQACGSLRRDGDLVASASCSDDALAQDPCPAALPAAAQGLSPRPGASPLLSPGHPAPSCCCQRFITPSRGKAENSPGEEKTIKKPQTNPEVPLKNSKHWQVIGLGLYQIFSFAIISLFLHGGCCLIAGI